MSIARHGIPIFAFLLAVSLDLLTCSDPESHGLECRSDTDCGTMQRCFTETGECEDVQCKTDGHCGNAWEVCEEWICVNKPCSSSADCPPGTDCITDCCQPVGDADTDTDTDTDTDADVLFLAWLGDSQPALRPAAKEKLKVALVNPSTGPISEEDITFELLGSMLDAYITPSSATTNSTGVAEIELTAATQTTAFQVRASHPEAAHSASLTVSVEQVAKQIVLATGSQLTLPVGMSQRLTAKLVDGDTKLPLAGESMTMTFQQPFDNLGGATLDGGDQASDQTNGLGRIDVVLGAGSVENSFNVVVSSTGAEDKLFSITAIEEGQTATCRFDQDCPAGQYCENGKCKDRAIDCTDDLDCAFGETCESGQCVADCDPATSDCCVFDSDCEDGEYCDNGECSDLGAECQTNQDCWDHPDYGDDYVCRNGVCTEMSSYKIDTSGKWSVSSLWNPGALLDKDLRAELQSIFGVVEQLESYINLDFLRDNIPILGDLIADWIRGLIPEKIIMIVEGANDAIDAFDELQINSTMTLAQHNPPATPPICQVGESAALIRGKDDWHGITVWFRLACGDPMNCAPSNPDYPRCDCAEVEFDLEEAGARALARQFEGCVEQHDQPALDMLLLREHAVTFNWGALIRYVLEEIILDALSGVNSFEDLFAMLIDCGEIGDWADDLCQDLGFSCASTVENPCDTGLQAAAGALRGYLDGLTTGLDEMTYSGYARIEDQDHDNEADYLGPPEPPAERFGTGRWSGEIVTERDRSGTPTKRNQFTAKWRGER